MTNFWKYFSTFFLIGAILLMVVGLIHSDDFFIKEAVLMIAVAYLAYKEHKQLEKDPFFKGDPFHTRKRKLY